MRLLTGVESQHCWLLADLQSIGKADIEGVRLANSVRRASAKAMQPTDWWASMSGRHFNLTNIALQWFDRGKATLRAPSMLPEILPQSDVKAP